VSEDHDDFAFEPVRGLPDRLPEGERMLWQGAPDWRGLAVHAFHVRKVAVYFALVALWQAATAGEALAGALVWTLSAACVSIAILTGLAWLYARSTVYTLTTRRVVIRSGLALPVTLNLPLSLVDKASVRRHGQSAGSVAFEVTRPHRVAYLVLWPNARPFALSRPQPMLRALADVDAVIPLLGEALGRSVAVVAQQSAPAVAGHEDAPAGAAGIAA
jgi:hypothetical protein